MLVCDTLSHDIPADHIESDCVAEYMLQRARFRDVLARSTDSDNHFDFRVQLLGGWGIHQRVAIINERVRRF